MLMNNANVKLSKTELSLVTDASVILTKNNIIAKVYNMFGELSTQWQSNKTMLPAEASVISPKIYKGEQHLGLPYVMLDYPRLYTAADVLAIRCFFWWGNFFSITLHISGSFLQQYKSGLHSWIEMRSGQGWHICVNTNAWQHHFGENNYCSIDVLGQEILDERINEENGFVKLAKKMPLEQWDDAVNFYLKEYGELMQVFKY